ncbi:phage protein, HK97 gp10 family [Rhizobium sp. RU35A]|nr:phage protein, HK97 gp10 family [Rhizobium sp. RU35A]
MAKSRMTGADGIVKAFRQVTLNLKTPIQQASRKALKPILQEAKANLTEGHGVETGHLKKLLTIKPDPKNKAAMHVGPNSDDPHYRVAHLVEFGTQPHDIDGAMHPGAEAKPFLTPAFEAKADEALKIFGQEIGPAIEKAAERAAAKATKK